MREWPATWDEIMAIAKAHDLLVVEDAAQGVMSAYKGKALGTIGDFGAIRSTRRKLFYGGGRCCAHQ